VELFLVPAAATAAACWWWTEGARKAEALVAERRKMGRESFIVKFF
jgi:hypothetical protein